MPVKEITHIKTESEKHEEILRQRNLDLAFIEEHTRMLNSVKNISNKRVFALKGKVNVQNPHFSVGSYVWYIGPAPSVDGFKAIFIFGKNKKGKNTNIKIIMREPNMVTFKYIDVPVGFTNDNGLYKLTKDQIIQYLENAINLRVSNIEQSGNRPS